MDREVIVRNRDYCTSAGYRIRVRRGGNKFRPRTNDFAAEVLIDAAMDEVCRWGWTDRETAQQVLDDLAAEHGWTEVLE